VPARGGILSRGEPIRLAVARARATTTVKRLRGGGGGRLEKAAGLLSRYGNGARSTASSETRTRAQAQRAGRGVPFPRTGVGTRVAAKPHQQAPPPAGRPAPWEISRGRPNGERTGGRKISDRWRVESGLRRAATCWPMRRPRPPGRLDHRSLDGRLLPPLLRFAVSLFPDLLEGDG
jgi:hypothetical protein